MNTPTKYNTHPMVLVAAASVTALSIAGIAHLAGWNSAKAPTTEPAAVVAAAPVASTIPSPVAEPAPTAKPAPEPAPAAAKTEPAPVPKKVIAPKPRAAHSPSEPKAAGNEAGMNHVGGQSGVEVSQAPVVPPVCKECGSVESINDVTVRGEATPLGAIAGGVIGGILGNQVGNGRGRDLATIAGAIGGAYAGREVEKNTRTNHQYEITVRFDDGTTRTFTQTQAPSLQNGDRVKLVNGGLSRL